MAFDGFPKETFEFLKGLGKNNNKTWFQAHYDDYQAYLMEPAKDFVVAMGKPLAKLGKDIHAEPKVGGSIYRINRDIRFSKDKRPYKTHLDLWFWQGSGPGKEHPGYWFRMTPDTLMLGAGMHMFDKPMLDRYRAVVVDDRRGRALATAVDRVLKSGPYDLGGSHYKRVPAGVPADHPRTELLLHNALYVGAELPLPREVRTPKFPALVVDHFKDLRPLQKWLVELVGRR